MTLFMILWVLWMLVVVAQNLTRGGRPHRRPVRGVTWSGGATGFPDGGSTWSDAGSSWSSDCGSSSSSPDSGSSSGSGCS